MGVLGPSGGQGGGPADGSSGRMAGAGQAGWWSGRAAATAQDRVVWRARTCWQPCLLSWDVSSAISPLGPPPPPTLPGCGKTTLLGSIAGSAMDLGRGSVLTGSVQVDGHRWVRLPNLLLRFFPPEPGFDATGMPAACVGCFQCMVRAESWQAGAPFVRPPPGPDAPPYARALTPPCWPSSPAPARRHAGGATRRLPTCPRATCSSPA